MRGTVYLIKLPNQKVVPALCLENTEEGFLFAQIRIAKNEDRINTQNSGVSEKKNKKKEKTHQKQVDIVYIGQPEGLKSKSVVMVKKLFRLKKGDVIKPIAQVSEMIVNKCLELSDQIHRLDSLHKELHSLKRKVQLAQFNNERYSHYEKRIEEICKEIGYKRNHVQKTNEKSYLNYREVPFTGFIKVFRGGR